MQPQTTTVDYNNPVYHQNQYLIRRKFFKIFGASFHIYDMDGNLAFFSKQKAFKLKEDIRVFGDQAMTSELLCIKARGVIDLGMTYDVIDSTTQQVIGSLRRKGLKSIIRDSWVINDVNDQEFGTIQEESGALAILRRFLGGPIVQMLAPQKYNGYIGDVPVLEFTQNRNPFVQKIQLDYGPDVNSLLDRRLGIAAAALLCAVEGRQS
ncbi:MAG: hypothetical protein CMM02_20205 [Rhodopirellula sp.]|nr:hypothetical protein [Rhodopirellula sp.]